MTSGTPRKVLVTGDQTIDWAVKPSSKYISRSAEERLHVDVRLCWHAGGVFQIASMIRDALGIEPSDEQVFCAQPDADRLTAYRSGYNHSFSVIGAFDPPAEKRNQVRGQAKKIYRMSQFLGFRHNENELRPVTPDFTSASLDTGYPVIVVDDANLGFRKHVNGWTGLLDQHSHRSEHPRLLLKVSHSVQDAPDDGAPNLWRELSRSLLEGNTWLDENLIVLTAAARLRDAGAEVSKDLSWEQSANDVIFEIDNHPLLSTLRACRQLIVSFGPSGAMLIRRQGRRRQVRLIYNRDIMEKEWANHHCEGMMFGHGSAMCSALACELASNPRSPNIESAIKHGLVSMQLLYNKGFDVRTEERDEFLSPSGIFQNHMEQPLHDGKPLFETLSDWHVDIPVKSAPNRSSFSTILPNPSEETPINVARKGAAELDPNAPVAVFGKLTTVDRKEIESLHAIYNLLDSYCAKPDLAAKPLAIAVFGSPGSGKGYAIKQVADPWRKQGAVSTAEFNLSQFNTAAEIVGALHQIRDIALDGQIPMAIWDEFDSPLDGEMLGWLKYFLAPIQDGKFQQGEVTHLIGPSVFVFAGGTSETFQEFNRAAKGAGSSSKALDFLSRLRGYIDIRGVNASTARSRTDPKLMLRRAIILNSLFEKYSIGKDNRGRGYNVDEGVLRAFLTVPQYKHGVRSMEAIIQMSGIRKGQGYFRSSLPSQDQLDLHVSGRKFLEIMRGYQKYEANG